MCSRPMVFLLMSMTEFQDLRMSCVELIGIIGFIVMGMTGFQIMGMACFKICFQHKGIRSLEQMGMAKDEAWVRKFSANWLKNKRVLCAERNIEY